jgi:Protein of unknown function (DUF2793)
MPTPSIANGNITLLDSSQEFKEELINGNFRAVAVARVPIQSRTITTPPTTPDRDDFYIVPSGASGAWSGKTHKIAYPATNRQNAIIAGQWLFFEPFKGLKVCLLSGEDFVFDGTTWAAASAGGDMNRSVYDTDNDGIVDASESIAGSPSDDTFYGKQSGNKGFFDFFPKVLLTILTGLSTATGGAIAATDTLLQALGKLQRQINNLAIDSIDGMVEIAIDKTYTIVPSAKFAFTINNITISSVSGTCSVAVQINGVSVTGLSAISVSSTPQTLSASGANSVAIGNAVTMLVSSTSPATDVTFSIQKTR